MPSLLWLLTGGLGAATPGTVPAAAGSPFSLDLFTDRVTLRALIEGDDGDAGTVEAFGPPGDPLPCTSKVTLRARPGWAGDQEIAITTVQFAFPDDPAANKGDALTWSGRTCRVIAPAHLKAGAGSLYILDAQIRD
jgi:hypothetical protein